MNSSVASRNFILEDVTGAGKIEAALILVQRLMAQVLPGRRSAVIDVSAWRTRVIAGISGFGDSGSKTATGQ